MAITLDTDIDSNITTLRVHGAASEERFPFYATIDSEKVVVTGKNRVIPVLETYDLFIQRGVDRSTSAAHSAGTTIEPTTAVGGGSGGSIPQYLPGSGSPPGGSANVQLSVQFTDAPTGGDFTVTITGYDASVHVLTVPFDAGAAVIQPLLDAVFGPGIATAAEIGAGYVSGISLAAGGADYVPGETVVISGGGGTAVVTVDTVDGGGAVLTCHLTTTAPGYAVGSGVATATQSGVGTGFTVDILSVDHLPWAQINVSVEAGHGLLPLESVGDGAALTGGSGVSAAASAVPQGQELPALPAPVGALVLVSETNHYSVWIRWALVGTPDQQWERIWND